MDDNIVMSMRSCCGRRVEIIKTDVGDDGDLFAVKMQSMKIEACLMCVFATAATISTFVAAAATDECAYVRRPFAATTDTVVINVDCTRVSSSSQNRAPLLPINATRVAVRLVNCLAVPLGLFADADDRLRLVTVASEDALQLLQGTFDGLQRVRELRLMGFSSLQNLSRWVFQPLRNVDTLVLDQFGRSNIKLAQLGAAIQALSGTRLRRLVLNDIRGGLSSKLLDDRIMRAEDFGVAKATVKQLVVSDTPLIYEGSFRRAFPHLVCFRASKSRNSPTEMSFPAMFDLVLLSSTLSEFVLSRYRYSAQSTNLLNVSFAQIVPLFLDAAKNYPELLAYLGRTTAADCAIGFKLKLGANITSITIHRVNIFVKNVKLPVCFDADNKLEHLDLTGTLLPSEFAGIRGLTKLRYFSLENTRVQSLAKDLMRHLPALEVLKLGRLDVGTFVAAIDAHFFAASAALKELHLDNCRLPAIPEALMSALNNIQPFWRVSTSANSPDYHSLGHANLKLLNFSGNAIRSIGETSIRKADELASRRPNGNRLLVDLSENIFHCLCNTTTEFIRWLRRSPEVSNIEFLGAARYRCLYPNGSVVRVSTVNVDELRQHCDAINLVVNGSDCPCDEQRRTRLQQIWVSLEGFYCRNDAGDLVPINDRPLPSCFDPYARASFIVPVVLGGVLAIIVLVTIGLLYRNRHSRRVRQVCRATTF